MARSRNTAGTPRWSAAGRVLSACLLASGIAALTYEVLWLRQLSLVMGHTVYALAAVLTSFLGGLALGAYLGGRWTRRQGVSVWLYAGIEVAIAATALPVPWLAHAMSPLFGIIYRTLGDAFVAYNLAQFVLCGVLVLVPTLFMGATLPVVTALLVGDRRDIAVPVGRLYALNSLGGVLGAALTGFVLLPRLGMNRTALVAVAFNLVAAAGAAWLARRESHGADIGRPAGLPPASVTRTTRAAEPLTASDWPAPAPLLLALFYGLSGFAALALEVGWARIVSLSIGSTTYGFTITLVAFICGLVAGSALVPRWRLITDHPVRTLYALHITIALWSLLTLPYLGSLPRRVVALVGRSGLSFGELLTAEMLLVLATITVATVAMGGMFPLVTELLHRSAMGSGESVGASYSANTLGNILGSFVAGFVLVPAFGMRATIVISAMMTAAVGLGYAALALRRRVTAGALAAAGLAACTLPAAVWAPGWDRELVTSAPYLNGRAILEAGGQSADVVKEGIRTRFGTLLDYREGATTVVSVRRLADGLAMQIGGVGEGYSFSPPHSFIAHLPLLLHGGARDVLVVGLGSGNTLASVLQHGVERVDCVEVSREVRDMARLYFSDYTDQALDDARVRLTIADGRNYLRYCQRSYDVIISQPSHTWASGAASLFTREYFAEMRQHLNPGGIACTWFITYSDESRKSMIKAWTDVFPDAYLFEISGVQCVLIGLRDAAPLSAAHVAAEMTRPQVRRDLSRLGIGDPADVFGSLVVGPEALRRYADGAPANTDDNAYVEFIGLRGLLNHDPMHVLAGLNAYREDPAQFVDPTLASPEDTAAFSRRLSAIFKLKRLALEAQ